MGGGGAYGMGGANGMGGYAGNRGGARGIQGGMGGMAGMAGMGGFQGGGPGNPDGEDAEKEEKPTTGIRVDQDEKFVVFKATLALENEKLDVVNGLYGVVDLVMLGLRGELNLMDGGSHVHRLAKGLRDLGARNQGLPYGAYNRVADNRNGYQFEPEKRVSWMAELLPYMGYQTLSGRINRNKSWDDKENLMIARTLIPEFLDPSYPRNTYYVAYPGLKTEVAATHYVGLAGLGEDVASEAEEDAGGRVGAFSFNRTTPFSRFAAKGTSNLAVMMRVPPRYGSPWMAGGGSTVRGVPEKGKLDQYLGGENEQGTYVLMGDGSVRFVKKTISPEVFREMCTLKGKNTPLKEDEWNRLVPDPGAEMKGKGEVPKKGPGPVKLPPVKKQ
jgi:hypothetical protein